MIRTLFILITLYVCCCVITFAQIGQTGAIKGTVTFIDGSTKCGINVTLESPALVMNKIITITNSNGHYFFANLAPGKYNITYDAQGISSITQKGIIISANVTITLDVQMEWNHSREAVAIKKGAPIIDRHSVTNVSTMDKEFFKSFPRWSNFEKYLLMIPGLTGEPNSPTIRNGISCLGSTTSDNIYSLDGINIADPALGTYYPFFSLDTIEEVSVQTSGINASQMGGKGAVINIITKSGGNRFKGAIAFYHTNKSLQGKNTKGTPLEDISENYYSKNESNLSLQGPLIKNKLWFSSNFNLFHSKTLQPGYPYDKEKETPINELHFQPFIKITYHPQQRDQFIFTYNYFNLKNDHIGASPYTNEDTTFKSYTRTTAFRVNWNHYFRRNLYTNIKLGFFRNNFADLTKNDNGWGKELLTNQEFGNGAYDDINSRQRIQIHSDSTLYLDNALGMHEIKFGGQFSFVRNHRRVIPKYDVTDPIGIPRVWTSWNDGIPYLGSFHIGFNKKENSNSIGIYINDTWNVSRYLTLNLGVRINLQTIILPRQKSNQNLEKGDFSHIGYPELTWNFNISQSMTLLKWGTWAPRLGFIYDFNGNGRFLLKGNFSRYYQNALTSYFDDLSPIKWVGYEALLNQDGSINYIYNTFTSDLAKQGYKGHSLKTPYTNELLIGLEAELWENYSMGIRYIRRWDLNLIETVDANSLNIDKLLSKGELDWTNWEPIHTLDPYNGQSIIFWNQKQLLSKQIYIVNPPGAERNYRGWEFQIKKRFAKGWMINFSYNYGKSEGLIGNTSFDQSQNTKLFENPNAHINAYGHMPMETRHQFRLSGLLRGPLGINFSGYFHAFSGFNYSRQICSIDLGLNLFQGIETIWAESRGSRLLPFQTVLDIRIEKKFSIKKISLHLFADIFNVFNNNKSTSVNELSSNPIVNFEYPINIMPPRSIRLGAKLEFN